MSLNIRLVGKMTKVNVSVVVTSIFEPTKALKLISAHCQKVGWDIIIVGDVSSPDNFKLEGANYFSLEEQKGFDFNLAAICPERHYTRKNLGYLKAIAKGAQVIVETDDDNIPNDEFWFPRNKLVEVYDVKGSGWNNIYNFFTDIKIWPRGLPLQNVLEKEKLVISENFHERICPIQQGLANENPDVDAVFRMTHTLPVNFDVKERPYRLGSGLWCPFNSQNTTWFQEAFPLLYLPSFCTFRMTDIWRSFVAQRIAWECDWGITFHNATVYQERNEHNLLKDFEQEIPGYLLNDKIRILLEPLNLRKGIENVGENMLICYEKLIEERVITDKRELTLLTAWLEDLTKLVGDAGSDS